MCVCAHVRAAFPEPGGGAGWCRPAEPVECQEPSGPTRRHRLCPVSKTSFISALACASWRLQPQCDIISSPPPPPLLLLPHRPPLPVSLPATCKCPLSALWMSSFSLYLLIINIDVMNSYPSPAVLQQGYVDTWESHLFLLQTVRNLVQNLFSW